MATPTPPPDPADPGEPCIHCGGTDFLTSGFGPRTLVLCTACGDVGTHAACEAAALGVEELDEDMVDAPWFCGEVRGVGGRGGRGQGKSGKRVRACAFLRPHPPLTPSPPLCPPHTGMSKGECVCVAEAGPRLV